MWLLNEVAVRRGQRVPGFGGVAAVGTLAGLVASGYLPARLVLALTLCAAGAACARTEGAWQLVAMVPGAAALGWAADATVPVWVRALGAATVVVAAPLVGASEARIPRWAGTAFAISAFGVYATVPDTETAVALAGGGLASACCAIDARPAANRVGAAVATALLVWTVMVDGHPRSGAVVGGVLCLGLLVVPWVWPTGRSPVMPIALAGVAHAIAVAVASRVAGLEQSGYTAALIAVPTLAVAIALVLGLRRYVTRSA